MRQRDAVSTHARLLLPLVIGLIVSCCVDTESIPVTEMPSISPTNNPTVNEGSLNTSNDSSKIMGISELWMYVIVGGIITICLVCCIFTCILKTYQDERMMMAITREMAALRTRLGTGLASFVVDSVSPSQPPRNTNDTQMDTDDKLYITTDDDTRLTALSTMSTEMTLSHALSTDITTIPSPKGKHSSHLRPSNVADACEAGEPPHFERESTMPEGIRNRDVSTASMAKPIHNAARPSRAEGVVSSDPPPRDSGIIIQQMMISGVPPSPSGSVNEHSVG